MPRRGASGASAPRVQVALALLDPYRRLFLNATMHWPPVAPHTVTLLLALNPDPHRQMFLLQPLD